MPGSAPAVSRCATAICSRSRPVFDRIETLPIPVIAAINGFALGGGCEMSLACDFRFMADHARIGVPEVRIGALAGAGGVQKLHRLVGRGKALEWILLGSHVPAAEALAHGLVTAVHPAAELMPAAMELAGRFRLLGPAPSHNRRWRCGCAAMPI